MISVGNKILDLTIIMISACNVKLTLSVSFKCQGILPQTISVKTYHMYALIYIAWYSDRVHVLQPTPCIAKSFIKVRDEYISNDMADSSNII